MSFTAKDRRLIKALPWEKHAAARQLLKEFCEQKLESLIKSLLETTDKYGSV